jgi:flagella basal body P-ring formation protein FlgA
MIWWIVLAMRLQMTACTPIQADRIETQDLARAIPEFSIAPPGLSIGYSPSPGSRRVYRITELQRLASKFHVGLMTEREACFEWPLAVLTPEQAIAAMRQSLEMPEAKIEVVEMPKRPAPPGEVVFPISSLIPPADRHNGFALWRGYVRYAEIHRFDIWARVKISAPMSRVVAVEAIPPGQPIAAAEVKVETVDDFPLSNDAARSLDEVVGRVPRWTLATGHAVLRTELSEPIDVKAGDVVEVYVKSGHAHLKFEALAEGSGRRGEMIALRNPKSGKTFRGRVEAEGKAIVVPQ